MKKITILLFLLTFSLFSLKLNAACGIWKNRITSFSTGDTCKTGYASFSLNNVSCCYIKWTINGTLRYQGQGNSGYNYMSFTITQNGTYNVCVKISDTCNKCDTTICSTITISCFKSCNWKSRLNLVHMTDTCQGNNYSKINSIAGTIYYATGVNSNCYRYQWSINNVLKGTSKNFNYKITQNGTYTQCIKITDSCNKCDTTICRTVTFSCFPNCNWKGQNPNLFTYDSCAGTTYYIMANISFNWGFPGSYKQSWTMNGNPVSYNGFLPITSNGTYTVCVKVTDTIKKCDTTFCKQVVVDCIKVCNWKSRKPDFFASDTCPSSGWIVAGITFNNNYLTYYKYKWTFNGSPISNTSYIQQFPISSNGTYTVCLKVTDTVNKCDTTFCKQVVVSCINACKWKSKLIHSYFNDSCSGNGKSATFHGYVQFSNGGCYKYRWTVNGVPIKPTSGLPDWWLVYNITQNGTYTLCVKVTDTCNQCDTTFCSTKTFSCINTCNWKGKISNIYMSDTCRGYNNKNNIHGYVGFKTGVNTSCFKYEWKINNALVSKKDRMDYNVTQNGTYYQCLKITDTCNNCDTTICRYVTFNCINKPCSWKPKIDMTINNKCLNNKDTILAAVYGFNGISCPKFTWTLNGVTVPRNYVSVAIPITQNGTYQLCAKVRDTCNNCDTFVCKTFTVNCFTNSKCRNWKGKSSWFQVWDSCQSNNSRKNINGYMHLDTPGCYKYQWTVNGNPVGGGKNMKYNLTGNGTYYVCVKVTDTCTKCDTTYCSTRTITCFGGCNFKAGKPSFATYDTCLGNRNKVTGYVSFTNKPCLKYLWTVGGVGVSTSPTFTSYIYTNGTYKICVKVSDTCNKCDTTFCTTRVINCSGLGIKNIGFSENIKAYPNPVDGQLNIDWSGGASSFEVFDVTGNLIHKGELIFGKNTLQTDTWANGLYMIRVNSTGGTGILKIVVNR